MTDPLLYRSTLGALQYLCNTRPDIEYIVNRLSQFLKAPTDVYEGVVKRVLRYLKGTSDLGILIQPSDHLMLFEFSDVD